MGTTRGALLVLVGAACASSASIRYAMDPGPLLVEPGSMTAIDLYLEFTGPDAALLAAERGLYGAGARVAVLNEPGAEFALAGTDPILANVASFDDAGGALIDPTGPLEAGFLLLTDPFADDGDLGVVGEATGPDARRIRLGSVRVQAPSAFNAEATIALRDFGSATADTVTWESLQVLDERIESASVVLRTIPAPGALVLGVSALLCVRRPARYRG